MVAAFLVAFAIALAAQFTIGGTADKIAAGLRATARWSFLWFWPAYAGGALVSLFGPRFQAVAQRARDFGLAFASAHLVHLALVAWLMHIKSLPRDTLIIFGIGAFWIYVLAFLSIGGVAAKLNAKTARVLRTVGIEYIAYVFLLDFAKNPFEGGARHLVAYLPFLILAIAGPLLRLAALAKRQVHARGFARHDASP